MKTKVAVAANPRTAVAVDILAVLVGAALMAASAQISVPMVPVPVTLQTLAIPLVVALFGTRRATAAMVLYLAEGAAGLPVFHGGLGGAFVLAGPTAGYLWSYPLVAFVLGRLYDAGMNRTVARRLAAIVGTSLITFALGWAWLATLVGAGTAFASGVAPFIVGDLAKSAVAACLGSQWPRLARALGVAA
jgi:biotin transport system substrate-specific component